MKRSSAIGLCTGVVSFAVTDATLHALAFWLAQSDLAATSAFVRELFLPFFPMIFAGIAAGYLATPHGFAVGLLAGMIGSAVSLAWRYQDAIGSVLLDRINATAMFSWIVGTAIASGVCGWAGERLHAKGGMRPDNSSERTREE